MRREDFVIVSSGSAWSEPVVMVHAVGCGCRSVPEAMDDPREWKCETAWTRDGARLRSEFEGRRIGAVQVAWMDCTL